MYLQNGNFKLRALEPEDLELLYIWENQPELWTNGNTLQPYSRYILKEYIAYSDKTIYEKQQLRLMIERTTDATIIGTIDLFDFDAHHSRAGVGILIDKPFQKQGFGQQTLNLLIEYAFGFLHLNQLYAHISTANQESISLFQNCGFTLSGTLKQWFRQPYGYDDVAIFQLFATDKTEHKS